MPINSGYLLPGAELLRDRESGFFETYKGVVETETGKVKAYVKLLHNKALAGELVCTVLGQAAKLPVPNGYLIEVHQEDYPDSLFLKSQRLESTVAFGSEELMAPNLARRFMDDDKGAFDFLLESWIGWQEAMLFDEWIANADRHPGNFIVNGPNDVWLIDHSHAFRGPSWGVYDLNPGVYTENLIARHAERRMSLPERHKLLTKLTKVGADYEQLTVSALVDESRAVHFLSEADMEALRKFLTKRVRQLPKLISKRVGIPMFSAVEGN